MKAFDLQRMAFDKVPPEFLGEVALRSLYTFVWSSCFLKSPVGVAYGDVAV